MSSMFMLYIICSSRLKLSKMDTFASVWIIVLFITTFLHPHPPLFYGLNTSTNLMFHTERISDVNCPFPICCCCLFFVVVVVVVVVCFVFFVFVLLLLLLLLFVLFWVFFVRAEQLKGNYPL